MSQKLYRYFAANRDAVAAPTQRAFLEQYEAAYKRLKDRRTVFGTLLLAPGITATYYSGSGSSSLCSVGMLCACWLYQRHEHSRQLYKDQMVDRNVLTCLRKPKRKSPAL